MKRLIIIALLILATNITSGIIASVSTMLYLDKEWNEYTTEQNKEWDRYATEQFTEGYYRSQYELCTTVYSSDGCTEALSRMYEDDYHEKSPPAKWAFVWNVVRLGETY